MSAESATVYLGTGRRKTATARVRLTEGTGTFTVNGRPLDAYFPSECFSKAALRPLVTAELRDKMDVTALVSGGGIGGQAGAVSLGIARALLQMNGELRPVLKPVGLLRRDPRERERKKSGQPGARKRFQFSKR
ncbi:MAG: 30S ribosomal protein S9 [Puniceicoccaceae bacterium]|nr:MAG: 30S ribosomal protein S9 [Puniceicoccaceae bacterium]